MRRSLQLIIALVAMLATTPQSVLGQDGAIRFDVRPGTEIEAGELGELLASSLRVSYPGQVVRAKLQVQMISREERVVGKYESERTVDVKAGETYPGDRWISGFDFSVFAPGFGDRRKITFGRMTEIPAARFPRECEGASHALQIALVSDEGRLEEVAFYYLCITVER